MPIRSLLTLCLSSFLESSLLSKVGFVLGRSALVQALRKNMKPTITSAGCIAAFASQTSKQKLKLKKFDRYLFLLFHLKEVVTKKGCFEFKHGVSVLLWCQILTVSAADWLSTSVGLETRLSSRSYRKGVSGDQSFGLEILIVKASPTLPRPLVSSLPPVETTADTLAPSAALLPYTFTSKDSSSMSGVTSVLVMCAAGTWKASHSGS